MSVFVCAYVGVCISMFAWVGAYVHKYVCAYVSMCILCICNLYMQCAIVSLYKHISFYLYLKVDISLCLASLIANSKERLLTFDALIS